MSMKALKYVSFDISTIVFSFFTPIRANGKCIIFSTISKPSNAFAEIISSGTASPRFRAWSWEGGVEVGAVPRTSPGHCLSSQD